MRLVCISDTHQRHGDLTLPEADILIHTGDIGARFKKGLLSFSEWFLSQPHRHKVLIGGNHDFFLERHPETTKKLLNGAHYLSDSGCIIEGLKFWGSPVSPRFFNLAFNRKRGAEIKAHWDKIPPDTQILLCHTPAFGILDRTQQGKSVGCEELAKTLKKIQPEVFISGHIHEAYGSQYQEKTLCVNASSIKSRKALNPPILVERGRHIWQIVTGEAL